MHTFFSLILSLLITFPVFAQTTTPDLQNRTRQLRETFQQEIQQKREAFRAEVEQKRAQLQDQIQAKREELKQRLQAIRDERKKRIVERIDQQMDALNERMVNHFSQVLVHLEKVLERIVSRTNKAEERGLNVASVRTAVTSATAAIGESRAAIQTQTGKTYTIAVTTENTLKLEVGKARQALHNDLKKVRETVKAAHDAVRKAAVALAQIPKVDTLETTATSTESGTQQ